MIRLELGAGQRPTPGYLHNDMTSFDGIDLVGPAWQIDLPDQSVSEVLALGMIEHLRYHDAHATFANVHRMLSVGGMFLFDVPDLPVWCQYLLDHHAGKPTPFSYEHILSTLYGWQRWEGDEHKSGWTHDDITDALTKAGFDQVTFGVEQFLERGHERRRMHRPADAHIYVTATR